MQTAHLRIVRSCYQIFSDHNKAYFLAPLLLLGLLTVPVRGQSMVHELQKLTASQAAAHDEFGFSVSMSGNVALVGGVQTESAYIYYFDGTSWAEEQRLTSSDGVPGDVFGISVSVSGDVAVVGARRDDDLGTNSGSAYVFRFNGSEWEQQQKLTASDGTAYAEFGNAVAVDGDTIVVGAFHGDGRHPNTGAAYVYRRNHTTNTWEQEPKLFASDGEPADQFGASVSVSGDVALVAAYLDDYNGFADCGSVHIYRVGDATSELEQILTPSDAITEALFGFRVSVDGEWAFVGAYGDDAAGVDSGSAYVFRLEDTSWEEKQKLVASDGAAHDQFGAGVSVDGEAAVVGAFRDDTLAADSGSAYVYALSGTNWVEDQKLVASDGTVGDRLGATVAVSGNVVLAGATGDAGAGVNTGSAYMFVIGPAPETDPPTVSIVEPFEGEVLGTTSVSVTVDVVGSNPPISVASTPAGIYETLATEIGTVSGLVPLDVEGENVLAVGATDNAGKAGSNSVTVYRDTTVPIVSILSPDDDTAVGTAEVTVMVDVLDATGTTVLIGGQSSALPWGGGAASAQIVLAEGPNSIVVSAVDEGGNVGTGSVDLVLDTAAPIVTIDEPADAAVFGLGSESVGLTATVDDLTATELSSDPTGIVSDSLPAGGGTRTGLWQLEEGWNTATVTAVDAVGTEGSASVSVLLDTTAPSVTITSPGYHQPVSGFVDVDAEVVDPTPGSGIAMVDFELDGALIDTLLLPPYGVIYDTALLTDGLHEFGVIASDGIGNEQSKTVEVVVDNTLSSLEILGLVEGQVVGGSIPFTVWAEDLGTGLVEIKQVVGNDVEPTLDDSETYDPPVASDTRYGFEDTTRWPDGALVFSASATDAAGNQVLTSLTVELDNTAPRNCLVSPSDGQIVVGTIVIQAQACDPNLASIEILVDGVSLGTSQVSPFSLTYDTEAVVDGSLVIQVVVRDLVGNEASCAATVFVDNMSARLVPKKLNLKSKGKGPVQVHLVGPNLALLLPTEEHGFELRVPGGSPIPSITGWGGDDSVDEGKLKVQFDRPALINSIIGGIVVGTIDPAKDVPIDVAADGKVLQTILVKVKQ